jgi:hypothetical protein
LENFLKSGPRINPAPDVEEPGKAYNANNMMDKDEMIETPTSTHDLDLYFKGNANDVI